MHPSIHARAHPDRAAYIMAGSGETVTYSQLEARSNQGAQLFRKHGLAIGRVAAMMMDNNPRFIEIAWAAQRSGIYMVYISSRLLAAEVAYIMQDSGAEMLITSPGVGPVVDELPALLPGVKLYMTGEARAPYENFEAARAAMPETPITDESRGNS